MTEHITTSQVIDRCLAAASSCIELGNDSRANDLMKAAFREVAREVSHWHLSGEIKAGLFLAPIEEQLLIRHGEDLGRKLYVDFVDAFWIQTWVDLPLEVDRLERSNVTALDMQRRIMKDRALRRRIATQDYSSNVNQN